MERILDLEIRNKFGIHARVAAMIVESANKFSSEIVLEKDGAQANAKSIMEILLIAASQGEMVRLRIAGEDSVQAEEAFIQLFRNGFGEPM